MNRDAPQRRNRDPLDDYTLDALLEGAASLRPDGVAMQEDGAESAVTYAAMARQTASFAARLLASGIEPGEAVGIFGTGDIATITAMLGCMRAGIDAVMLPLTMRADQIALLAGQAGLAGLMGGAEAGGINLLEKAFSAAALSDRLRLVGSLAHQAADAADFSPQGLAEDLENALRHPAHEARIATLRLGEGRYKPVFHRQRALVAAALDLIARAGLAASSPVVSTLAPHSFAGLVAGPVAALLSGATLHLHGLFDSKRFLRQLAQAPMAHLCVPAALLPGLEQAGLLQPENISGIVALSRWQADAGDFSPPRALAARLPVTDLHAFGEHALVPEARGADGCPRALLDPPHQIDTGGISLLAVEAAPADNGALRFFGAAVSEEA